MITILLADQQIIECRSVIIVPDRAIDEPGYIQTMAESTKAHSKHDFHAMSQMAYYQYQDDELPQTKVNGSIIVTSQSGEEAVESGLVLCRDGAGEFHVFVSENANVKKLLEAAFRFCTRWVRLDI